LPLGEEAAAGDTGDGAAGADGDVEAGGNVADGGDLDEADTPGGEVVHGPWAPEDSGSDEEDASEEGDEPAPRE